MARSYPISSLLLLSSLLFLLLLAADGVSGYCHRCSKARAFVMMSCSITRYPIVCEKTLMKHVDGANLGHKHLAEIALKVSLKEARYTRAYLTKMGRMVRFAHWEEAQAIGDCVDQINDSVSQLRLALRDLKKCGNRVSNENLFWYMSNVETWASTALTDQINCAAAFEVDDSGRRIVRSGVRAKVVDVTQVTSNALALVNRVLNRYRLIRGRNYRRP